jgi:L-amino acid N-acyltransferase YncA
MDVMNRGLSPPYRLATREDLVQIVAIYNATIASRIVTADTEPVSVESRQQWFEAHQSSYRPLWVREERGEVQAWLSFSSFYGRPAYSPTAEVSVYVKAGYRRQGIAREFLTRAIAHAPSIGLNTLLGFIFGHNTPSLSLFEGLRFERWGLLPKVAVLDGIERDLVIVGRRV